MCFCVVPIIYYRGKEQGVRDGFWSGETYLRLFLRLLRPTLLEPIILGKV